jgi:hypothetical protein
MTIRADAHGPEFNRGAPPQLPVRAATTASITISTALNNGDSLDGLTLATGDRVLVKNQSTGSQNGIYIVGVVPVRSFDMSEGVAAWGAIINVIAGTANAATLWRNTNATLPTIDTTALTFVQIASSGLTDPMTSRGDIIVRNASNVTDRLAKGAADTYLGSDGTDPSYSLVTDAKLSTSDITTNNASTSKHGFLKKLDNVSTNFMNGQGNWAAPGVSAAGLNAGTSNPGSPTDGDLFFRTDIEAIIRYRSSGTRWVDAIPLRMELAGGGAEAGGISATAVISRQGFSPTYDIWVDAVEFSSFVNTTNDASKNWTLDVSKLTPAAVATSIASRNTGTTPDTVANDRVVSVTVGALVAIGTHNWFLFQATKVSTPGVLFASAVMQYRRVIP